MAAAIGATAPNTRGDTFFDVYEWGGRPGDNASGSVDDALERIRNYILNVRDAGSPTPSNSPAVIYFRESTKHWFLQRPFFVECRNWEIRGAGREQTVVEMVRPSRAPCFIIGMPRAPRFSAYRNYDGSTPLVLDASHWVDCRGVLDATAAPAAGVRWGLRFKNDSNVSCPLTPLSHGTSDGWTSTRQMTVDFCINPGDGQKLQISDLFGMGDVGVPVSGPKPWQFVVIGTNLIQFQFATTGTNQVAGQSVEFSLGDCTGLMRITFQIDLINARASAFVRCDASATYAGVSKQIATTVKKPASFTPANNMAFARNQYFPFNIGKHGATVVNQGQPDTVDHTYFGLQISNKLLYNDASIANPTGYVGTVQTRVDGNAISDLNRYFDSGSPNCVAYLTLTDPPPGDPKCYNDGRVITISGNGPLHKANFTAAGYFLSTNIIGTPIYSGNNRVCDMTVLNGNAVPYGDGWVTAFGQAIAVGASWEVFIENVTATAFGQAIGSLNAGAAYRTYVNDCVLTGGDAAIYGYWQAFIVNRCLLNQGRASVRLATSGLVMNDCFIGTANAGTDAGFYMHYGQYGSGWVITNCIYDNESPFGPVLAAIVCEGADVAPTTLQLTNFNLGRMRDDNVLIWLKDAAMGGGDFLAPTTLSSPRNLIINGLTVFGTNHTAQIRTDGTMWNGTVDNFQMAYGGYPLLEAVPMFDHTGPGGLGRIVQRSRDYAMPPRNGKYVAGGHILEMQLPTPGQYATLRCSRSGTMNTENPPMWTGSDPIGSEIETLGGYLVDHSYWAPVALS